MFIVLGPTLCSDSSMFLLVMGTLHLRTEVAAYPSAPPSLKGPWPLSAAEASSFSDAALQSVAVAVTTSGPWHDVNQGLTMHKTHVHVRRIMSEVGRM